MLFVGFHYGSLKHVLASPRTNYITCLQWMRGKVKLCDPVFIILQVDPQIPLLPLCRHLTCLLALLPWKKPHLSLKWVPPQFVLNQSQPLVHICAKMTLSNRSTVPSDFCLPGTFFIHFQERVILSCVRVRNIAWQWFIAENIFPYFREFCFSLFWSIN